MAGWAAGVFTRARNWVSDKANLINPQAALFDQEDDNFATGLNNCVTKDGLNKPSATMDWNNQRLTSLGAATARSDALQAGQFQDGTITLLSSVAGTNTITGSLTPALAAYLAGQRFVFTPAASNTGATTININGLGAIDVLKFDGDALVASDLVNGIPALIVLDSGADDAYLLNPQSANLLNGVAMSDLARLSQSNTFTAANQGITFAGTVSFVLTNSTASAIGIFSVSTELSFGTTTAHTLSFYTNNLSRLTINSSGNYDFKGGTVTTTGSSAAEVGTAGVVQNSQSGNYTLVIGDRNKHILYTGAGGHTITIPANASVAFPVGTVIAFVTSASGGTTIAITTDTLTLAGAGTTGSRTLAAASMASALKIGTASWIISGAGLS